MIESIIVACAFKELQDKEQLIIHMCKIIVEKANRDGDPVNQRFDDIVARHVRPALGPDRDPIERGLCGECDAGMNVPDQAFNLGAGLNFDVFIEQKPRRVWYTTMSPRDVSR